MDELLILQLDADAINFVRCLRGIKQVSKSPHSIYNYISCFNISMIFIVSLLLDRPFFYIRQFMLGVLSHEDWKKIGLAQLLAIIRVWPTTDEWTVSRSEALQICGMRLLQHFKRTSLRRGLSVQDMLPLRSREGHNIHDVLLLVKQLPDTVNVLRMPSIIEAISEACVNLYRHSAGYNIGDAVCVAISFRCRDTLGAMQFIHAGTFGKVVALSVRSDTDQCHVLISMDSIFCEVCVPPHFLRPAPVWQELLETLSCWVHKDTFLSKSTIAETEASEIGDFHLVAHEVACGTNKNLVFLSDLRKQASNAIPQAGKTLGVSWLEMILAESKKIVWDGGEIVTLQAPNPIAAVSRLFETVAAMPIKLIVSGGWDREIAETLAGTYVISGIHHGRPVYKRISSIGRVLLYFYDQRSDDHGWWFGPRVRGQDVWANNDSLSWPFSQPPSHGWRVLHSGAVDPALAVSPRDASGSLYLLKARQVFFGKLGDSARL